MGSRDCRPAFTTDSMGCVSRTCGDGRAVILLTRAPFDGAGKTRMASVLNAAQRDALGQAMLADEAEALRSLGCPLFVYCTPAGFESKMRALVGEQAVLLQQCGGTLEQRMANAFRDAFERGYAACVLVGSDAPELSAASVEAAFDALDTCDAALAPTFDGGYCLAALRNPAKVVDEADAEGAMAGLLGAAFPAMAYGTDTVFAHVVSSLEKAGFACQVLEPCFDLDTPDDLREFLARNAGSSRLRTYQLVSRILGPSVS
jgi:rSAM/selenodomain-associated transferase 1